MLISQPNKPKLARALVVAGFVLTATTFGSVCVIFAIDTGHEWWPTLPLIPAKTAVWCVVGQMAGIAVLMGGSAVVRRALPPVPTKRTQNDA